MIQFILTPLLLAVHFATQARAHHFFCTWELPNMPWDLEYQSWCAAKASVAINGHVTYKCYDQHVGDQVADWNVLGRNVLEFGTPCGGGGYARRTEGIGMACIPHWAVCVGNLDAAECRGLRGTDDCESDMGEGNVQWHVL